MTHGPNSPYQDQEDSLRAIESQGGYQKFVRDYQGKLSTFEF